ncbi:MAG: Mur ligase family protein, partial [Ramlibacter sp.]
MAHDEQHDDSPLPADPPAVTVTSAPVAEGAPVPAETKPARTPAPLPQTLTAAAEARAWRDSLALGEPAPEPATPLETAAVAETEAAPAPAPIVLEPFPRAVLVLGLGESGLAMARWCVRHGADVVVADTRDAPPRLGDLRDELSQVTFVGGTLSEALLEGRDAVYRSPGLSPAQVEAVLRPAKERGLVVGGELALFNRGLLQLRAEQGYAPAVLAVTGTNGKTTVTSLTGQLVERSGRTVAVAGNIGPTLLDTLAARIASQALPQVWVL